jgi:hypothetical protein
LSPGPHYWTFLKTLFFRPFNEQGFAMLGDLKNVKPGTAAD